MRTSVLRHAAGIRTRTALTCTQAQAEEQREIVSVSAWELISLACEPLTQLKKAIK